MKKLWLIAFLFNIAFLAFPQTEMIEDLQQGTSIGIGIKTSLIHAKINYKNQKINWGTGLTFGNQKNSFSLETGNLSFTGSISRFNNPKLSSTITPFSTVTVSNNIIECNFESAESFSKPLSFFSQYKHTNKNSNTFLLNSFYIPENNTIAFSSSYQWIINKVILTNKTETTNQKKYGISFTAGLFPYKELTEDFWFLSEKYYGSGYIPALSLAAYTDGKVIDSNFMINIYETVSGFPVFTFRNENLIKIENISFSLSEYFNYGLLSENMGKPFSTSGTTLDEVFQIKMNIQNEKKKNDTSKKVTLKKGITFFGDFDLYNIQHNFKASTGISRENTIATTNVSSNMSFTWEPDVNFYLKDLHLKITNSLSLKQLSISFGLNCIFYPQLDLFSNDFPSNYNFERWKNQQTLSFNIKSKGDFSVSSNISATLMEKGWKPYKWGLEYGLGFSYKKDWFSTSISFKDSITCEF